MRWAVPWPEEYALSPRCARGNMTPPFRDTAFVLSVFEREAPPRDVEANESNTRVASETSGQVPSECGGEQWNGQLRQSKHY